MSRFVILNGLILFYLQGYDAACDVWSLGVILFGMLFGTLPFKATSASRLLIEIKSPLLFPSFTNVSEEARDLIIQMLDIDFRKRIKISEIYRHPWIEHELLLKSPIKSSPRAIIMKKSPASSPKNVNKNIKMVEPLPQINHKKPLNLSPRSRVTIQKRMVPSFEMPIHHSKIEKNTINKFRHFIKGLNLQRHSTNLNRESSLTPPKSREGRGRNQKPSGFEKSVQKQIKNINQFQSYGNRRESNSISPYGKGRCRKSPSAMFILKPNQNNQQLNRIYSHKAPQSTSQPKIVHTQK